MKIDLKDPADLVVSGFLTLISGMVFYINLVSYNTMSDFRIIFFFGGAGLLLVSIFIAEEALEIRQIPL